MFISSGELDEFNVAEDEDDDPPLLEAAAEAAAAAATTADDIKGVEYCGGGCWKCDETAAEAAKYGENGGMLN